MKKLIALLTFLLSYAANAQSEELVEYQVDVPKLIETLRISPKKGENSDAHSDVVIESVCASTVYLRLNPTMNYELVVNEDFTIEVSSDDILASSKNEKEVVSFEEEAPWLAEQSTVAIKD